MFNKGLQESAGTSPDTGTHQHTAGNMKQTDELHDFSHTAEVRLHPSK